MTAATRYGLTRCRAAESAIWLSVRQRVVLPLPDRRAAQEQQPSRRSEHEDDARGAPSGWLALATQGLVRRDARPRDASSASWYSASVPSFSITRSASADARRVRSLHRDPTKRRRTRSMPRATARSTRTASGAVIATTTSPSVGERRAPRRAAAPRSPRLPVVDCSVLSSLQRGLDLARHLRVDDGVQTLRGLRAGEARARECGSIERSVRAQDLERRTPLRPPRVPVNPGP